ncbi:hypothetical protein B0H34DRAFT_701115 [Crassisporium funariophilum]|nr:hypothetical protein B0H34DRAFT_701115 [Crassisporium funariophilum]
MDTNISQRVLGDVRDKEYYMDIVVFWVEGYLFKVPTQQFTEESEVFQAMFTLPQDPDLKVDGQTDDQPLRLEGVKQDAFRQLLRVMYPRGSDTQLTFDQCASVLELSIKWDMDRIRRLSIMKMEPDLLEDPQRLLLMGHRYHVDDWVIAAFDFFVRRADPMGLEDVEQIGIADVLKISSIRECCCRHHKVPVNKRGSLGLAIDLEEIIQAALQSDSDQQVS